MSNILLLLLQAANNGSVLSLAPQVYAIVDEGGSGGSAGGSGGNDLLDRIAHAFRLGECVVTLNEAFHADKKNETLRNDLETAVNEFFGFILDHFPHPNSDNREEDSSIVRSIIGADALSSEEISRIAETLIPVALARAVIRKTNAFSRVDERIPRHTYWLLHPDDYSPKKLHPLQTAVAFGRFVAVYRDVLLGKAPR